MDPKMMFGTGSPLLGGTDALNEAIARRGGDASAMAQVGGAAPTAQPMPVAPTSGGMPPTGGSADMSMGAPLPQGAPPIPGQPLPQGQSDSEIILNALATRLKSDSKIKEAQNIPPTPPQPSQVPTQ
jgi:hypothetical protein